MNTLDLLFSWFLSATVRGALLALAVLLLRAALRGRMPARWRYALWLPMIFVLVAPGLPRSRWSLENRLVRPASPVVKVSSEEASAFTVAPDLAETTVSAPKAGPILDRQRLLELGWLAGSAGMFVFVLTAYARTMLRIRRGAVDSEPRLQHLLTGAARTCGLRRLPRLFVSTEVRSPAVAGLFRPTLLLPASFPGAFTENEAQLILVHELTHLKRHDLPQNWLFGLLQALHWCNPVVWFAFNRIREDREAACDSQVLATAGGDQRADYGHALLELEGVLAHSGLSLGFVGIFERSSGLRARIRAIAAHQPSHPAWGALGSALVLVLALVGATRAQNSAETEARPAAAATESDSSAKLEETNRKLMETIIPKIEFRNTPVREALDSLAKQSVEFDPAKTGVQLLTNKAPAASLATPLTLSLSNVPIDVALHNIAVLANLRITVENDGVHFRPHDVQPDEYVTRGWPWTEETKAALGFNPGMDLKACLLSNGISFPLGASGQILYAGTKLIVKNTPDNVNLLEHIIHPRLPGLNGSLVSRIPSLINLQTKVIKQKLETIVIPHFEVRNATLREAIDLLRKDSIDLDPDKQGVNFVLKLESSDQPESAPKPGEGAITVSLSNIRLREALLYVTALAKVNFRLEPHAVAIVPLNARAPLITMSWNVPREFMRDLSSKSSDKPWAERTKDALIAQGVNFPPGASAVYLEPSENLIVKNTSDGIEMVDSILEFAKPAAKPAGPGL